jgi:hypothetical protein
MWDMKLCLYEIIPDSAVLYCTILSASVAPQSAPHMLHYYFSEKIIERGEKIHKYEKREQKIFK